MKKKVIVIRHANSTGNFEGIIQGKKEYHLSEVGNKEVIEVVKNNYNIFKDIDCVICSSMIRTYETAKKILDLMHKDIKIIRIPYIDEVDAGIISGKKHNEIESMYPNYYKIWIDRRDLDGIPSAEKGEELQARCIAAAFIIGKRSFGKALIVTHAAFMRCFINTLECTSRWTPRKVNNLNFYIVENMNINERFISLNENTKNNIFIFNSFEKKYILKCFKQSKSNSNYIIKNLKKLSSKLDFIQVPIVFFHDNLDYNESIKVCEYKEGKVVLNKTQEQHEMIVNKLYLFHVALNEQFIAEKKRCKTLKTKLIELSELLPFDSKEKKIADVLLDDCYVLNNNYIVWDDCHANNILVNENKVTFIDLESFIIAPVEYVVASYIASSIILNQRGGLKKEEILFYVSIIDEVNSNTALHMIVYRLATGLMYFKNNQQLINDKEEIYKKYCDSIKLFCECFSGEDALLNIIKEIIGD